MHRLIFLTACATAVRCSTVSDCDILIAGGSLAAAAAALSAANSSAAGTVVCLLEATDELGGQLTVGAVPAIDFGDTYAKFPLNLSPAFAEMLSTGAIGDAGGNPGACTVSKKCFPPQWAASWLNATAARLPSLRIYYRTLVTASSRDSSGNVVNVTAIQRTPVAGTTGWEQLLSVTLPDWYSPTDSALFTKETLSFTGLRVVIDASEFGDVLMTSGVRVAQGVETPDENSTTYDDACGQETAVGFYISWSDAPAPSPDPAPPGDHGGFPFHQTSQADYNHTLTWRRSWATDPADDIDPRKGDLFLIQSAQDLPDGMFFLPLSAAYAQVQQGAWAGGVNLTTLSRLEQRAYGWYHAIVNFSNTFLPEATLYLQLNYSTAGTGTGLAKMPYLREARRSQYGVQGFRMCHEAMAINNTGPGCWKPPMNNMTDLLPQGAAGGHAYRWVDTIAIGSYGFDTHRLNASFCTLPSYLMYEPDPGPNLPYYLPLRALTSWDAPNLLVAGKNMAQTFYTNSATRLHPEEWATGMAAGVTANILLAHGWNTTAAYENHTVVQQALSTAGQPMEWV